MLILHAEPGVIWLCVLGVFLDLLGPIAMKNLKPVSMDSSRYRCNLANTIASKLLQF
jgi:hypothetical protein